jgi:hypothetical protein
MAEPTVYSFDLKELAIALIKQQGLHEGTWMAALEFNLGAGMISTSPGEVRPGALIQVNKIQLIRQNDPASAPHLTVDASEVNPAPSKTRSSERKERLRSRHHE